MKNKIIIIIFVLVLVSVCLIGCNESTDNGSDLQFDTTQSDDCPTIEEVDQWEENFKIKRDELVDYMINTDA